MDCLEIFKDIFAKMEAVKAEKPTAGTKFRLMGLVADIAEVTQALQTQVLDVVSHEAVLDADAEVDYAELAEQVLAVELQECVDAGESVCEQTRLVNEALGVLNSVLVQIPEQLERHHKEEEYERLYEAEKRRYMNSGTAYRARKTFEEWKDYECYGHPLQENIEDYRMGKILQMFEKGVFNTRVEQMQRAKRYQGELDFDQLDDDNSMKKTAHRHYAVLRKLVDWRDGCLVVEPARVGRHFYACRHEENAKTNRTNFLKYMHKVSLAQEELRKLEQVQQEKAENSLLPDMLATEQAMKYWALLQKNGFVDKTNQLLPETTRKQAMYIADMFSDKLQLRSKWKPFHDLWHINNLAQEKWDMQESGKVPVRSDEIDRIFER